jgi:hypothetical protein
MNPRTWLSGELRGTTCGFVVEDNPWFSPIAQWAEPSRFATELRCPLSFAGYVHSQIAVDGCGFSSVSFPPPLTPFAAPFPYS